jgi:hypothetical protein
MGAETFSTTATGPAPQAAFNDAVRSACWESGNGGYTGTIAEKHDFTIIDRTVRFLDQARKEASRLLHDDDPRISDKWGPAGALPYYDPPTASAATSRTVTVTVTTRGDLYPNEHAAVNAAVAGKVRLAKGETITRTMSRGLDGYQPDATVPGPERHWRYRKVTTSGRKSTRYIIPTSRQHSTWETGFATQTEAVAYARVCAADPHAQRDATFTIEAVTRRETGEPLAAITRELVTTTWTVVVDITKYPPLPANAPISGWLFFGWASS